MRIADTTTAVTPAPPPTSSRHRPSSVAGVAFVASWIVGLTVFTASTDVHSSGTRLLSVYKGHELAAAVQFVLTQGAPAVALVIIVQTLARVARVGDGRRLERVALATGLGAALISMVQCVLGLYLTARVVPDDHAHSAENLFDAINRLDGVKMYLLAGLAIAGVAIIQQSRAFPHWLARVAVALAASLAISGLGYLFLQTGLALAAWVSLPLLLVWICGVGVALRA